MQVKGRCLYLSWIIDHTICKHEFIYYLYNPYDFNLMKKRTDFLVIGSGIAGLTYALKACSYGKVTIITKSGLEESNTRYAQGGIAGVFEKPDNFEKHIQDTLIAGDGFCDEAVVRMVVNEAPDRIRELIELECRLTGGRTDLMILQKREVTLRAGYFTTRITPVKRSRRYWPKR